MRSAALWSDLVTAALLGTDRRDPPEPPAGPLADVVADTVRPTPSGRMLATIAACTVARRTGLRPARAVARPAPPEPDLRSIIPPAAAARWQSLVVDWPVLEDEWLATVQAGGWQLSPDVLVGLLRRHRQHAATRARVMQLGAPVADWLVGHVPELRAPNARRQTPPDGPTSIAGAATRAVDPAHLGLLDAPGAVVGTVLAAGVAGGALATPHRAVLVNLIAGVRPDALADIAAALRAVDGASTGVGLAHTLADLAETRRTMLDELDRHGPRGPR